MQGESKQVLFIAATLGITGLVYFLSLLLHLPFFLTVAAISCLLLVFGRWLNRAVAFQPADQKEAQLYHHIIMVIAVAGLTIQACHVTKLNGDWDAWAIWNFAAKYLSDGHEWQRLRLNIYSHSNYPLCLPSVIAFFNRLFQAHDVRPVAFTVSLVVAICMPMLLFFELYRKPARTGVQMVGYLVLGLVILSCFALDHGYFVRSMSQYADTLLAFFFLAAIVVSKRGMHDKDTVLLYSIFLAFCIWTKDEGLLLALIFLAFHFRDMLKKKNWLIFFAIMLIPAIEIIYQKTGPALGSDIITGQKHSFFSYLTQWDRYRIIWGSQWKNLTEHFAALNIAIIAYIVCSIIARRLPGKHFLLLFTCLLGYFMVYVITPFDLNWHLLTSQDRLIHQLMPSFLFVVSDELFEKEFFLRLPFRQKKLA